MYAVPFKAFFGGTAPLLDPMPLKDFNFIYFNLFNFFINLNIPALETYQLKASYLVHYSMVM